MSVYRNRAPSIFFQMTTNLWRDYDTSSPAEIVDSLPMVNGGPILLVEGVVAAFEDGVRGAQRTHLVDLQLHRPSSGFSHAPEHALHACGESGGDAL